MSVVLHRFRSRGAARRHTDDQQRKGMPLTSPRLRHGCGAACFVALMPVPVVRLAFRLPVAAEDEKVAAPTLFSRRPARWAGPQCPWRLVLPDGRRGWNGDLTLREVFDGAARFTTTHQDLAAGLGAAVTDDMLARGRRGAPPGRTLGGSARTRTQRHVRPSPTRKCARRRCEATWWWGGSREEVPMAYHEERPWRETRRTHRARPRTALGGVFALGIVIALAVVELRAAAIFVGLAVVTTSVLLVGKWIGNRNREG